MFVQLMCENVSDILLNIVIILSLNCNIFHNTNLAIVAHLILRLYSTYITIKSSHEDGGQEEVIILCHATNGHYSSFMSSS